jgi:hypothetical protein
MNTHTYETIIIVIAKGVNYPHLTEGACNRGLETARLQFNLCEG